MLFHYTYAGYVLASRLLLPELPAVATPRTADIRIEAIEAPPFAHDRVPDWQHAYLDPQGNAAVHCLRIGRDYVLRFPGVGEARLGADAHVSIWQDPGAGPESLRHILLDQVLPRLIAQRGRLTLHAAMVRTLGSRTLLLLGESGRGKSTLTGAMLASGHAVLTDDGVVLDLSGSEVLARHTYPSVRLLPDSLRHLFPRRDAETLPMAHYSNKRRLALPLDAAAAALPLDAVIVLGAPTPSVDPALVPLGPSESCLAMLRNAFQLDLSDAANVGGLLVQAADIAQHVPVYRFDYPRDYDRLPDVISLLDRNFESTTSNHIRSISA